MSGGDDWQPGDLALCVKVGPWIDSRTGNVVDIADVPKAGRIYRVAGLFRFGDDRLRLVLEECRYYPLASRFRKIRPHMPDAEDAETILLLTGTPVREPVA